MVFLQEVVPHNLEVLESLLGEYLIVPADGNGYFTAMLLKMATVKYEEHSIQAFYASKMGRNLMVTQVKVLLLWSLSLSLLLLLLSLLILLSSLLLLYDYQHYYYHYYNYYYDYYYYYYYDYYYD